MKLVQPADTRDSFTRIGGGRKVHVIRTRHLGVGAKAAVAAFCGRRGIAKAVPQHADENDVCEDCVDETRLADA